MVYQSTQIRRDVTGAIIEMTIANCLRQLPLVGEPKPRKCFAGRRVVARVSEQLALDYPQGLGGRGNLGRGGAVAEIELSFQEAGDRGDQLGRRRARVQRLARGHQSAPLSNRLSRSYSISQTWWPIIANVTDGASFVDHSSACLRHMTP